MIITMYQRKKKEIVNFFLIIILISVSLFLPKENKEIKKKERQINDTFIFSSYIIKTNMELIPCRNSDGVKILFPLFKRGTDL